MNEKIRTRVFRYGDEKESSWPPLFGTGGAGLYHLGEDGKLKEGPPPKKEKIYGQAPFVIQDTIAPYRHPMTGQVIESRSVLNATDKACGTVTTDKKLDAEPYRKSRERRVNQERRADTKEAMQKAIAAIDSGTAPLTEETKARCAEQNEIVSKALGFDAFNVAGRKDNGKGKRFRK